MIRFHFQHDPAVLRTLIAAVLATAALPHLVAAAPIPKSGTIVVHAGWKAIGDTNSVAQDRLMGSGVLFGVTFNDNGAGPLHSGPAECTYVFTAISGVGPAKGQCYFSDVDGDKIFADFSGVSGADGQAEGTNEITGGTGKYEGIRGRGPYHCRWVSARGHLSCTERFDYRIP